MPFAPSPQGLTAINRGSTLPPVNTRPAASKTFFTRLFLYDGLFLSLVCLLSAVPYVTRLGFYDDDWEFWSSYNACHDNSILGLITCTRADFGVADVRPIWRLYIAAMFRLFRNDPRGPHFLMLIISLLGILLLYLSLEELQLPRLLALTVPLVFALLPHYSSAKFWIASSAANLSLTLYFLSVYSALRALRTELSNRWCWMLTSVLALLASALSYEAAIPLFSLIPILLWRSGSTEAATANPTRHPSRNTVLLLASAAVIVVAGVKIPFETRFPLQFRFLGRLGSVVTQAFIEFLSFNFGRYGVGMPRTVWHIANYHASWQLSAMGILLSLVIYLYLSSTWEDDSDLPAPGRCAIFAGVGVIVFALAYSLFAAQPVLMFTATGANNRVAIVGALGTAILQMGGVGWLSGMLRESTVRRKVFCLIVAMACGSDFLANSTLASSWISAFTIQQQILSDVREHFSMLPAKTVFLLDGTCTNDGPGPIFGKDYDLTGALQILYGDRTIRADVVTPTTTVEKRYLTFRTDERVDRYFYDSNMVIYNFKQKISARLMDFPAADQYFATHNPKYNHECASEESEPS